MVKYFAMAAAVVTSLVVADLAQARGPHGCASCSAAVYSGGCPGGVCAVSTGAPVKMATVTNVPPGYVMATMPSSAPVATAAQPAAPRYYASNVRRGLFGWRR
jgi:hypothetical protein